MSSITHTVGTIFQPIFHLFGWILAFFYGLVPNYVFAIVMLTVVIMGALTPFTIKSTKSMASMARIQPEIKKLQQKYKGPENRQLLNDELMKLYREEGVNPLGGCLPMLLQAPFLFILYSVIRGLSYTTTVGTKIVAEPRYIPHTSKMYENLVHAGGQIKVWGMDLSLKPFDHHGNFVASLPFFVFVALAVGLQYFQMAQINNRNVKTGQSMPTQQQRMQKLLPLFFAYFYLVIPAAVVLYMIVSTIIRIITQDLMFRAGISTPQTAKESSRELPARDGSTKAKETPKPSGIGGGGQVTKPQPSTPRPTSGHSRSKSKRKRKAR